MAKLHLEYRHFYGITVTFKLSKYIFPKVRGILKQEWSSYKDMEKLYNLQKNSTFVWKVLSQWEPILNQNN